MKEWEIYPGHDYFVKMLRNLTFEWKTLQDRLAARVRLGNTGTGYAPNYQLEGPGKTVRFSGRTHHTFHEDPTDTFHPSNLTRPYTMDEIIEMKAGAWPPPV